MTDPAVTEPSESEPPRCFNCEAPVTATFCGECGQKHRTSRVSLGVLLGEVFQETFQLEGRFPRTLAPFLFKPGFLTQEFNAGRRARYTSPFRLYLACSLLCLLMMWISAVLYTTEPPADEPADAANVTLDPAAEETEVGTTMKPKIDAWNALSPEQKRAKMQAGFREHLPTVSFALLPVFAFMLWVLYQGFGFVYVQHLVFSLHVHSFWFLTKSVALAVPVSVTEVHLGLDVLYAVLALKRVYGASWGMTLLRSAALLFAYGFCLILGLIAVVTLTLFS